MDDKPRNLRTMLAEAKGVVEKIDAAQAQEMAADGALLLDIRDGLELTKTGKAKGSVHVSRGLLEFAADPDMPTHNAEFRKDRPVVLFCASGGRAFLAGKLLKDMGYSEVYNLGGFKDWVEAGGAVE